MKNGLALFLTLLFGCGQQTKQNTSADLADIARNKTILLVDTSLKTNKNIIEQIVYSTLLDCNKYLSNDSLTFNISPTPFNNKEIIKKMRGVAGVTVDSKHISITIDPSVISWKETLKYAVAHEYNHAYWMENNFDIAFKWTLQNYLVFEGKADCFAHLLYPDVIAPWTSALSEKEKCNLWTKIKPDLQLADSSLNNEIMFGNKTYPLWGGYTLGFSIVKTALKNNSNLPVKTWTNLTADKILEMSDYKLGVH